MAYKRRCTRGASSSLPQRDGSHIGRPTLFVSQPVNTSQSYIHGQMHTSDQPLMFSSNAGNFEGSLHSFPSCLPTHPSSYYPSNASNLSSRSTSELGSIRAVSFYTPSTPTSSSNGDNQEFVRDATPCEHQSPNDADRALQGISSSNHDNRLDSYESRCYPNSRYDGGCHINSNLSGVQPDYASRISAHIPVRQIPLLGPWNPLDPYYNGQSYPTDMVEAGPFEELTGCRYGLSQPMEDTASPYRQQERLRSTGDEGYTDIPQRPRSPRMGHDYTYQESGNSNGDSPISSSSASVGTPTSSRTVAPRKIGGRKGPLTQSGRKNAGLMRKKGCCYRCFIMKEKCYLDEQSKIDRVCQRCRKIFYNPRSWVTPCSQVGLDGRTEYMVPRFMRNQLKGSEVQKFLQAHIAHVVPDSSLVLRLTNGLGEPLILENAVKVVPKDKEGISMHGVSAANRGSAIVVPLNSPPILPCLTHHKAIQNHLNRCLDSMIEDPNSDLPKEYFPEAHEHWEREMLTIIHQYHHRTIENLEDSGSGPYQTLRRALKLVLLNYTMYYPFVVPDEDIANLNQQLGGGYTFEPTEWVCPRLANKVIKCMLFPMLDELARRVLSDLHKLLRTKGQENTLWDPLFCIVFLCLIVVGKFQVSVLERAEIGLKNKDSSFLRHHAASDIAEMEGELSVHLIGQFHARFGTNRKGNGNGKMFNPLARDHLTESPSLAEEVSVATRHYEHQIFDPKESLHQHIGLMKEKNVMRILAKFMAPFWS